MRKLLTERFYGGIGVLVVAQFVVEAELLNAEAFALSLNLFQARDALNGPFEVGRFLLQTHQDREAVNVGPLANHLLIELDGLFVFPFACQLVGQRLLQVDVLRCKGYGASQERIALHAAQRVDHAPEGQLELRHFEKRLWRVGVELERRV